MIVKLNMFTLYHPVDTYLPTMIESIYTGAWRK